MKGAIPTIGKTIATIATRLDPALLEEVYNQWKTDSRSVDGSWAAFFEGFELGSGPGSFGPSRPFTSGHGEEEVPLQTRVEALVYAYRTLGHTIAHLDPLGHPRPANPLLELDQFGFSEKDLDLMVFSRFFRAGKPSTLRELLQALQMIYSDQIGIEFMHIQNARVRNWIRDRVEERCGGRPPQEGEGGQGGQLGGQSRLEMLQWLMEAEAFEHFLHSQFVGQKRFSLEGGETLLVALNTILGMCPGMGVTEIVMGMAHRGRLNVLANFIRKSFQVIFAEFSENYIPDLVCGDGDVKYHLGYSNVRKLPGCEQIAVRLCPNPSHLEAVDPVVEGIARARQRICNDTERRSTVLPLLIHGDAAFAGQGIAAETLNLSQLPGYATGGTLHLVVNNQIGFTTLPADARSSYYCTDVARMIEAPVFHVNADNPEAVAFVSGLAFEFRQAFKRDVVVDLVGYRRHGHNEGDEPAFTAPNLYARINAHPSVVSLYRKTLLAENAISEPELQAREAQYYQQLHAALQEVRDAEQTSSLNRFSESLAVFQPPYCHDCHGQPQTAISRECFEQIVHALTRVPEGFQLLPKIRRMLLERRLQSLRNEGPFDWAYAETLAFASLLLEGIPVRLSGQDSRRGTFSQRHSVLYDAKTNAPYIPLRHLSPDQATFCVYNSQLSEAAVLGFDYGYSLGFPQMLCLWEGQFGDFANGAQVIIDQFIVSAESKWQSPSGLVLLLPHGYEGQGPEHSSARLERFLQLCAEENIQVANPTTPAQYFHLLRRQMKRPFLKPLILMTPKSLLRAERAVSRLADFTQAGFQTILGDSIAEPESVERVIFCTGKIYYDLEQYRGEESSAKNTAIIRIEQLYPLQEEALRAAAAPFSNARRHVWCQEEPRNMGAWSFIREPLERLFKNVLYAGRAPSASPAVGSLAVHKIEQRKLIEQAFSQESIHM